MKKRIYYLLTFLILIATNGFCSSQWSKSAPAGTTSISDLDYNIATINNEAVDRLLSNYRRGAKITYNSIADFTVAAGEIVCSNSDGSVRRFRKNTSALTSNWTVTTNGLDAGVEAISTTYYVYAVADVDAETFTMLVSTSATAPTGATYYKKLGSFYNNSSSNIEQIVNDDSVVSVGSGTLSNGGTIPLPTGFSDSECKWTVGVGDVTYIADQHSTYYGVKATVNSSRVVTVSSSLLPATGQTEVRGDCNYLIMCNR